LIDDEDKSLGNKLALNDDEFQKLLDIPGVFRASEAPQPPERPDVQEIDAINRFVRDNPVNKADGGAIGGGIITGEDYGDRTGFAEIKKLAERFSNKPGKYFVKSRIGVRDLTFNQLKNLPGFVRLTSEGVVFDTKANAQSFIDSDLLAEVKQKATSTSAKAEARKIKNTKPELFNKIMELADKKTLGPTEIRRNPAVLKLNNGKELSYNSLQRIISEEKGKKFFKDLTKNTSYFMGDIRKGALANIDNILEDYYKGIGTRELTKKYFPNSPNAKKGTSATVLEEVIKEKADSKRLKNRPDFIATGKGVAPAQIILNNPLAKAEFIKFGNAPENRILDSMEEAGKIAKKYAPEGLKISGYTSRSGFMDSGLRDLITKEVEFSNPFKGRGEGERVATEVEKTRALREKTTAPVDFSGTKKFQFHHIMNIGGEIPLDLNDIAIIKGKMNRKLSPYNTRLNNIADSITDLINEQPKGYLKKIDKLNDAGEKVVKNAIKELPSEYKKLIGFNRVVPVLDEYGTPINFVGKKFGGSGKTNPALKLEQLSTDQVSSLKTQIKTDAKALEKGKLKDKILSSTGKILKGVGKVIKPVGYAIGTNALVKAIAMADERGIELNNLDKLMALDSGDPEVALNNARRRVDPEFAAAERAKDLAQMEDDFEEVGLDEIQPDETLKSFMANGGRAGFSNGGAAGADENFAAELEYFLTNEDAELPQLSTYSESNNPIEILNDIIDPRNYPYYADVLARSGLRIGEFATRILPATGKLINDLITKPAFKIQRPSEGVSKKSNYVQEYTDIIPSNIKGTGIFSEFLENITPTTLEKKVGLDKLIEKEEQKLKDKGSTVGPKIFADTIGLGAEVTAPIFPGLKLLRAYAANRNLPVNDVTKKILVKEIDEVLETQGMNRREFLQATGAGATVILAKMLGFGDQITKTAKVAEKATEVAAGGVPPYFFDLVEIIKKKGVETTKSNAIQDLQNVFSYKGYDLYEDLATGELRIEKTNTGVIRSADDVEEGIASQDVMEYKPGRGDESTKGIPPDEYEQGSVFPDVDGKLKEVEDLDVEEILEFIKNEKIN
jgi:hypothetical protein